MKNWTPMPRNDYDRIWDKFYADFSFYASVNPNDWPSIKTDKPTIKINIDNLYGDTYDEAKWVSLINKGINCFTNITNPQDEIIVLDWQHECFYVNPRHLSSDTMLPNDNTSILIPSFIPDGDYYIFITKDFENIWFGHPWEKTITIIGDKLIKEYKQAD